MKTTRRQLHKRRAAAIGLLAMTALGLPVAAQDEPEDAWPREIEADSGALVTVFQPQVDSLDGNVLKSRAAVMIRENEGAEPVFGAVWLESRISTDLDSRQVTFESLEVPQVRFPDATQEQEQRLIALLEREIPTWNIDLSVDRLIPMLDLAEKQLEAAMGFNDDPPNILFREEPTVLVSIEGEPQLREIPESGIMAVVNTPFMIVQNPDQKGQYFLYAGSETWYQAPAVEGPWQVTKKVPKKLRQLQPEEAVDPEDAEDGPSTPPALLVVTEPSELIVFDGPPQYTPIAGSELLIVSNTESDVLREVASQEMYVLLSGRWFRGASQDGPWQLVASDELSEAFSEIDPDGDYGYLLVWVAGTEMAEEAVLDAAIPQTAAIKRDATIEVSFDGEPKFEPIEETSLFYAVNTESQVIRADSQYFCAEEGAWYVADDPEGPWRVATEVPDEIRAIPASSPVYNTKYVYIYDSTPEVVYVGYYPGYTHSYIYRGVPVWGTGWWYSPWWSPYHFYPRASTWGFHVRWNPWSGWGFGFSYSTGRWSFSIGWSSWGRGGWWGPAGWHGYRRGYHRGWHHGYRAGARAGYQAGRASARRDVARNMYQRPRNADRVARTADRGGPGAAGRTPQVASGQANNVFTDRDGNVFRQNQDGSWQQRDGNQWRNTDMASTAGQRDRSSAADRAATTDRQRSTGTIQQPTTRQNQGTRQNQATRQNRGSGNLNRDAAARSRGNQRARSAPRGGGGRGGGRRR